MNRHSRRLANRGKKKRSAVSEVYSMTGKDGKPLLLDIVRMRQWAEKHTQVVPVAIDLRYIERLFERGAVSADWVKNHTFARGPKPIIVCLDINESGDEIVDGNHTYVASAVAWYQAKEQGLLPAESGHPWAGGYVLTPMEWQQFVVR